MAIAFCLDCNHLISLGSQLVEGQMITCSNCGAQLEVISLDPPELDWAYLEPAPQWMRRIEIGKKNGTGIGKRKWR